MLPITYYVTIKYTCYAEGFHNVTIRYTCYAKGFHTSTKLLTQENDSLIFTVAFSEREQSSRTLKVNSNIEGLC